jgi:glycerol kinase
LKADGAPALAALLVDGGVTENAWAMQFLADICEVRVEHPANQEVTALGAAELAALGAGLIKRLDGDSENAPRAVWTPLMPAAERNRLLAGWRAAVAGSLAVANATASA